MLKEFLVDYRELIERRSREVFLERSVPTATDDELKLGIPTFIGQLINAWGAAPEAAPEDAEVGASGAIHGGQLFDLGFTVSEVVHGYGSICEVVTKLATEVGYDIETRGFEILNRTLDVAIAEAVTGYQERGMKKEQSGTGESERLGALAHELRGALSAAVVSFAVLKKGTMGFKSRTSGVIDRSFTRLGTLIDRSLADLRLRVDPVLLREPVLVLDALEQISSTVGPLVEQRGIELVVACDRTLTVTTDRQLFMSVLANIVQNAVHYTRDHTRVIVRGRVVDAVLVIEVNDECGGLPGDSIEKLFQPFVRGKMAAPTPGTGLGLSIAMRAAQVIGGHLSAADRPGVGCTFTFELPL